MKTLYKILVPALLLMASCTKNIEQFNTETKRPSAVPAGTLFNNAVKTLSDGMATASVNANVFRHVVKHWGQATNQEEAQYDFLTRAINTAWWTRMYRDVINDLRDAKRLVTADLTLTDGVKANQLAMLDIIEVYAWGVLVNTFGNVPYTDALDDTKLFPVYDDAKTVYADILKRLAADIGKLNTASAGFVATEDFFYSGNVGQWIKFANTLYMRLAIVIADVDNATAKAAIEAASPNAISAAADNTVFKYLASPPNNNPLYDQLVTSGRSDFIAAKDLMDVLNNMSDPRKPQYFGVNNVGQYVGAVVGQVVSFATVSKPGAKFYAPDFPHTMADYVETEFLRAEAIERGYTVTGTAEGHYNNAIRASIIAWGGTNAEADTYLGRADVAYTTATGTWRQKIGFQKWIALYNRPYDGWVELRRLDYPQMPLPLQARTGFPNRLAYPGNEQQLNGANYTKAASDIGGDKFETKLWWDKF
ncbi:MAG: SusD/RagB family nutrient-binding outer membrane lipoprotein [Niastella sp.]|nr:SusD/RagB family nutrient-binding outer membrane lipoprotein [Niastella sp.]